MLIAADTKIRPTKAIGEQVVVGVPLVGRRARPAVEDEFSPSIPKRWHERVAVSARFPTKKPGNKRGVARAYCLSLSPAPAHGEG